MKRKIATPKIGFLILVLMMMLTITVQAQETTLTAFVPSSHTLHIELTGKGTLVVDGVAYTQSADIQVRRHDEPAISVKADNGYQIVSVFLGDNNITNQIRSDTFILPEMCNDTEFIVMYESIDNIPETNDRYNVEIVSTVALLLLIAMLGILVECRKTRMNVK